MFILYAFIQAQYGNGSCNYVSFEGNQFIDTLSHLKIFSAFSSDYRICFLIFNITYFLFLLTFRNVKIIAF